MTRPSSSGGTPIGRQISRLARRQTRLELIVSRVQRLAGAKFAAGLRYVVLYGSSVGNSSARDLDVLFVSCRSDCRFIRTSLGRRTLNLHIVTPEVIRADLTLDRFGWIFLTKLLGPTRLLAGKMSAVDSDRALAYLRLCGQWASANSVTTIRGYDDIHRAVVETLTLWNPQFQEYVRRGKIDLDHYRRCATNLLPRSLESAELLAPDTEGIALNTSSALYRAADLRLILLKYWGYYFLYQTDARLYLADIVDMLLLKKGLL